MSFSALIYTAAAVAFFALMIMRPVVDPTSPATGTSATVQATATTDGESTDSSEQQSADDDTAKTGEQESSDMATTEASGQEESAENTTTQEASDSTTGAAQTTTTAPDYARERRIGNQIGDAILDGEVLYLHDGSRNFMSIQTDADDAKGGAIILHGRGFHPDWEDTVNPLRVGLVEEGWTTLSLQMPVLDKQAKYYDYVPLFPEASKRIKAGIQHLKDQGITNVVLIAHSCGGHMAMHWLGENGDSDIAAFVGLGLGATDYQQAMAQPFPLDKLKVPVFDAYGENEFPAVIKMAPERWKLIKAAGNPQSEQRVLPAADHYFKDQGDELTGLVATWLNGLKL